MGRFDKKEPKLNEVKGQAQENPTPFAAAAGELLALLILIGLWRRRR